MDLKKWIKEKKLKFGAIVTLYEDFVPLKIQLQTSLDLKFNYKTSIEASRANKCKDEQ